MINRMPDDKIWLGTRRGGLYIYDPVSYTHLDVYKRQILNRLNIR